MATLRGVIACVDVHYLESGGARAAIVTFATWDATTPTAQHVVPIAHVEPYESGAFYKRELPCILAALAVLPALPEVVIVDGYVWLEASRPGLGARLLEAEPKIPTVVGVAKRPYVGAPAHAVRRGTSATPLWVDEAGTSVGAPHRVAEMAGPYRIPTMLRLVDQLCRGTALTSGR